MCSQMEVFQKCCGERHLSCTPVGTTETHPTHPTLPRDALSPRFRRGISLGGSSHLATSQQSRCITYTLPSRSFLSKRISSCGARLLIPYYEMNYPFTQCFGTRPNPDGPTQCWRCLSSAGQFFCSARGPMGWNVPGNSLTGLVVRAGFHLGTHWVP